MKGEQLSKLRNGYYGCRVTLTIDGERVRKYVIFETTNETVARIKRDRLIADGGASFASAKKGERFLDAAERVNALRKKDGTVRAEEELQRLRLYAMPLDDQGQPTRLGPKSVNEVTSDDISAVLEAAKATGKSRQTVKHLRNAIKAVFEHLVTVDKAVGKSPLDGAPMPKFKTVMKKETVVLEDAELVVYLGFVHPVERHRAAVFQRQVMSCVSRCFGGLRTNDLHVLTYQDAFEVGDGEFRRGWAPRTKGNQPQRLTVPEVLRPVLRAWWEHQGKPIRGLLFPCLRGERQGAQRTKSSHAHAFRKDLRRAFGIEAWDAESGRWRVVRDLTEREREIFVPGKYTEPVDFHSWRRAFAQALAEAAVPAQLGAALSGHNDLATHALYLKNSRKARAMPAGSVPAQLGSGGPTFGWTVTKSPSDAASAADDSALLTEGYERARVDSNHRHPAPEADSEVRKQPFSRVNRHKSSSSPDAKRPSATGHYQKSLPEVVAPAATAPSLDASTLARILDRAKRDGDWPLVAQLAQHLAEIEREAAPNVASLDAARKRKGGK